MRHRDAHAIGQRMWQLPNLVPLLIGGLCRMRQLVYIGIETFLSASGCRHIGEIASARHDEVRSQALRKGGRHTLCTSHP